MQKQQVFKVKGMQRDASMANANGEFAYEILNMRLMPAEDLSGFSLTNEKGTTEVITGIEGQVIGQCPTNDSLVVFTTTATYNENDEREDGDDRIYEIYQDENAKWTPTLLYIGNLNFHADKHIEALFNYETSKKCPEYIFSPKRFLEEINVWLGQQRDIDKAKTLQNKGWLLSYILPGSTTISKNDEDFAKSIKGVTNVFKWNADGRKKIQTYLQEIGLNNTINESLFATIVKELGLII